MDDTPETVRPLDVLVPLIQERLQAGDAKALEHHRRAGELLWEAAARMSHGQWSRWVDVNCGLSVSTAWKYMRLARERTAVV